ncbi:MAG: ABC transporter permease [Endomicrobiales bacterium]|nr:ABC transporter permease [Endomicrobiales bacterium]
MNIIELKDIYKTYHPGSVDVHALNGVSLSIQQGEFVAIMGASGSGKSTLLHVLGLLDKPTKGEYILKGQKVSTLSDDKLASLRNKLMGFVFQSFNLLSRVSAQYNVSLPLVYSDGNNNSASKTNRQEKSRFLLEKVGLGTRIDHKPNELSGGQQQRVAIARSLVNDPLVLFADEPTGNLDSQSTKEILELLKELHESGITVVLVTHEDDVAQTAKRIIKMQDGKIISDKKVKKDEIDVVKVPESLYSKDISHSFLNIKRIKDYFGQAMRALFSNKIRSFLSILGVLIGVASLIAMLALGTGARESIKERIQSLGSNILSVRPSRKARQGISGQSGSRIRLYLEDAYAIKSQIAGIKTVAPYVNGSAQLVYKNNNWNTSVEGTTADYPELKSIKLASGRFFTQKETVQREKVVVIGYRIVEKLFENQNPLGEFIKINRINFRVIGVLPEKGATGWRDEDDRIIVPINTAMYRLFGEDQIRNIDVQVANESEMEEISEKIQRLIAARHRVTENFNEVIDVRNLEEIQETITSTVNTFAYLLGSIAFISLLVGGIGIMNIMLVTVTERTREIGLRKAIGASNTDILSQFVIEAIAVCILGGVAGILLGSLISIILSAAAGWTTKISIFAVNLAFAFSVAIGLVFGIWPAYKASRLDPIDALRYE